MERNGRGPGKRKPTGKGRRKRKGKGRGKGKPDEPRCEPATRLTNETEKEERENEEDGEEEDALLRVLPLELIHHILEWVLGTGELVNMDNIRNVRLTCKTFAGMWRCIDLSPFKQSMHDEQDLNYELVSTGCGNVIAVNLRGCVGLTGNFVMELLERCTDDKVVYLNLMGCNVVESRLLRWLSKQRQLLFVNLFACCRDESVYIDQGRNEREKYKAALETTDTLSDLRHLHLGGQILPISTEFPQTGLLVKPNLEIVRVSGTRWIDDESKALLAHCPSGYWTLTGCAMKNLNATDQLHSSLRNFFLVVDQEINGYSRKAWAVAEIDKGLRQARPDVQFVTSSFLAILNRPAKTKARCIKAVKELIDSGWDVNCFINRYTPLMHAIKLHNGGGTKLLQLLLDAGAEVNILSLRRNGKPPYTVLKQAVAQNKADVVKLLLKNGAHPGGAFGNLGKCENPAIHLAFDSYWEKLGKQDWKPVLLSAITERDKATVQYILSKCDDKGLFTGALPVPPPYEPGLPKPHQERLPAILRLMDLTHASSEQGVNEMTKLLLEIGVDVNCCDSDGNGALHLLCTNEAHRWTCTKIEQLMPTIDLLVHAGLDVNQRNNAGRTPLHVICDLNGSMAITDHLMLRGGDMQLRDNDGKRPIDHLKLYYIDPAKLANMTEAEKKDARMRMIWNWMERSDSDLGASDAQVVVSKLQQCLPSDYAVYPLRPRGPARLPKAEQEN